MTVQISWTMPHYGVQHLCLPPGSYISVSDYGTFTRASVLRLNCGGGERTARDFKTAVEAREWCEEQALRLFGAVEGVYK